MLTYAEKTIKMFRGASLSHCMQHAACSMYQQCGHTLDIAKLAFLHTSFWQEGFLNISNHSPDSSFA